MNLAQIFFIPQFLRVAAGSFKDLDDLLIRVMHGLSGARAVIQEGGHGFFQAGRVFFGNLLQKRELLDKAAPPFAHRILSKAYLVRYLHVVKTVCGQKDYLRTLYLTGWKGPAFGKFREDGANGIRYHNRGGNKWYMNNLLVFSFHYAIY